MSTPGFNEIWVEGGDIPSGMWELNDGKIQNYALDKEVDLGSYLTKLEMVEYKNDRTLGGTGAAAVVGAVVAGPLGALAGGLWGGKKNTESVIFCELSGGKKFIAKVQNSTLPKLKLQVTSSPKGGSPVATISSEDTKARADKERNSKLDTFIMLAGGIVAYITYQMSDSFGYAVLAFFIAIFAVGFMLAKIVD